MDRAPRAGPPRPVLALDLGGTQIRTALVAGDASIHARRRGPTPVADGPDAIVAACVASLAATRSEAGPSAGLDPPGIAVSAPGPLDPWRGVLLDPPNLGPRTRDVALAAPIADALDLPVVVERDTNVAALAEGAFGAARGVRDYLYLTFSTGVGGAIVTDGRLMHGPDGTAGELGHVGVDDAGPPCGCGAPGHLEAIASGIAIARAARAAADAGESGHLRHLAAELGPSFGARDVARAEDDGDPVAARIMERARRAVAAAFVSLVDVFNPDLIVVGGSLARGQGERWLGPAREAVAATAFRVPGARVRIVPAELGDDVGLVGGLVLFDRRVADGEVVEPHR